MNPLSTWEWPTPAQCETLRNSMGRLIPACEAVSAQCYRRLFEMHPEIQTLFPDDMESQQEKLVLMLASAIDMLGDRTQFHARCAELGRQHLGYGARPEHYPIVIGLILEELGRAADPPLTEEEQRCWVLLFQLIESAMLSG